MALVPRLPFAAAGVVACLWATTPVPAFAQAAAAGLAGLPGVAVDQAVTRMLEAPDLTVQLKMIELVQQRRITSALPQLILGGVDVTDLQPQRTGEAADGVGPSAVTGQLDQ